MNDFLACSLTITQIREEYKASSYPLPVGSADHRGTPWPLALVIIAALAVLLRKTAYWSTVTLTAAAIAYLVATYGLAVLIAWKVLA